MSVKGLWLSRGPVKCPMCGKKKLYRKRGKFVFKPPKCIPGGPLVVPDTAWEECKACGEQIILPALNAALQHLAKKRLIPIALRCRIARRTLI